MLTPTERPQAESLRLVQRQQYALGVIVFGLFLIIANQKALSTGDNFANHI